MSFLYRLKDEHITSGLSAGLEVDQLQSICILLVDDFEPFRAIVRDIIGTSTILPGLRIISEAKDGPEAVKKAEQLRPDIVLLDIGLPEMNGIQAAQQIRKQVPECKILFVSQHRSPVLIREALRDGVLGYVLKSDVANELLPALQAVISNRRFISDRLAGYDLTEPADA